MIAEKMTFSDAIIKYGKQSTIPLVDVKCPNDEFENNIRKIGVEHACEWFGCGLDFTIETIETLCERSGIKLELTQ